VDAIAAHLRLTGKQKAHVARDHTQRCDGIALEPRLAVLLEGGIDRRAVSGGVRHRAVAAPGERKENTGEDQRFQRFLRFGRWR